MRIIVLAVALFVFAYLIGTPDVFRILIRPTPFNSHLAWVIGGYLSDTLKLFAMVMLAGGYADTLLRTAELQAPRLP